MDYSPWSRRELRGMQKEPMAEQCPKNQEIYNNNNNTKIYNAHM